MVFRNILKPILLGNYFKEEYICLDKNTFAHGLKVFLYSNSFLSPTDITTQHFLLGYKPMLIGFPVNNSHELFNGMNSSGNIVLKFCEHTSGKEVAVLTMKIISNHTFDQTTLFLAEGIHGQQKFLNDFHKIMNALREKFVKQKEGNISLPGNLYDQARIAYSVPRPIALVSIGDKNFCNIFPTDLHGTINEKYYADSLRINGKACMQVEHKEKIAISEISADYFREAYLLGKNHTQDFQSSSAFDVHSELSESFQIPLPAKVASYKELELIESTDVGIHRIFFFQVINEKVFSDQSSLAHIHNYYANWRRKKLITTDYLFR